MAESGTVKSFRDISSVNLRIAHEIPGAADEIYPSLFSQGIVSAIIAGPPLSGKTTLLRDLARRLSGVSGGRYYRVAIVDERGEIAASSGGCPQCDVGFSDVLTGYPKDVGILTALRTLSPQIIICDEIGNLSETKRILEGMNSGVNFSSVSMSAKMKTCVAVPPRRSFSRPACSRSSSCSANSRVRRLEYMI